MSNPFVVRAGKAVQLFWTLTAPNPAPPIFTPYDPPALPTISIFDPNGTEQVTAAAMTKIQSGLYSYIYATPADGALGVWTGWVDLTDANGNPNGSVDSADQQKATPLFQLV